MKKYVNPPIVLTVSGFDSGGAAGLHPDIKTLQAIGAYTITALTAVTAQNSNHLTKVQFISTVHFKEQLRLILQDYGCQAVKTGFIGRVELVKVLSDEIDRYNLKNCIVDPVLVNDKGKAMFGQSLIRAYRTYLFPKALCITPNIFEASLLTGIHINTRENLEKAARKLFETGSQSVLIKRFVEKDTVYDFFYDGKKGTLLASSYIRTKNLHGSGDTLSSALAGYIAMGFSLPDAVMKARKYTHRAITNAKEWHICAAMGPVNHSSD